MKKKLEKIIIETFYKDIDAMKKLRERFEKILLFISSKDSNELIDESDELIDETEKMIFELDKKSKDFIMKVIVINLSLIKNLSLYKCFKDSTLYFRFPPLIYALNL